MKTGTYLTTFFPFFRLHIMKKQAEFNISANLAVIDTGGTTEMKKALKIIIRQTLDLAGKQVIDDSLNERQIQIENQL